MGTSNSGSPVIALVVVLFLFVSLGVSCYSCTVTDEVRITISDKESVHSSENGTMRYVYTENGTYKCDDSMIDGKWNSADVYGRLKEGHTYEVKTRGIRIPFMSMFPNIVEVRGDVTPAEAIP